MLLTIDDTIFMNNTAINNGGALQIFNANCFIQNTKFVNHMAGRSGGAIYASLSNMTLDRVIMINNTASTFLISGIDENGGGSIWTSGDHSTILNVISSEIRNGNAYRGGGICIQSKYQNPKLIHYR